MGDFGRWGCLNRDLLDFMDFGFKKGCYAEYFSIPQDIAAKYIAAMRAKQA